MPDPTTEFFQDLRGRGHDPQVRNVDATVRFDLDEGGSTESWLLEMHQGDLEVSTVDSGRAADCVLSTRRAVFNGIASGATNPMVAMLRGELTLEGEPEVFLLCQRLMPEPLRRKVASA
jgi:putative sterol carrier protein